MFASVPYIISDPVEKLAYQLADEQGGKVTHPDWYIISFAGTKSQATVLDPRIKEQFMIKAKEKLELSVINNNASPQTILAKVSPQSLISKIAAATPVTVPTTNVYATTPLLSSNYLLWGGGILILLLLLKR